MSTYWDNANYEETLTFGIVSSNHNLVAEFSSTTDNALIKLFTNDKYNSCDYSDQYNANNGINGNNAFNASNVNVKGYILSTSNINNANTQSFTIGQILNSNNSLTPSNDFTIHDHNIGINNPSPKYTLDVKGTGFFSSNVYINGPALVIPVGNTATRPEPSQGMIRYNTDNSSFEGYGPGYTWGSLGGVTNTSQTTYIKAELYPTANDNTLRFVNSNIETMRISSNGFVGIGTDMPLYTLDVAGNAHFTKDVLFDTSISTSNLYISYAYITSNIIVGKRILSTSNTTPLVIGDQSYPPSVVDGSLQVNGNANITGTLYASKVRYGNAGSIVSIPGMTILTDVQTTNLTCIKTFTASNINANFTHTLITASNQPYITNVGSLNTLNVTNTSTFNSNITLNGSLYLSGNVVNISDKNIKSDLVPISNPLAKIYQLTGYTYKRTDTINNTRECGLIAQDVQKVLPEVVQQNKEYNDMLSIAYGNMAGLWVEAFKEMHEKIIALEAKVESLLQTN